MNIEEYYAELSPWQQGNRARRMQIRVLDGRTKEPIDTQGTWTGYIWRESRESEARELEGSVTALDAEEYGTGYVGVEFNDEDDKYTGDHILQLEATLASGKTPCVRARFPILPGPPSIS